MAGKEKKIVYKYSESGKFLKKYESMSEVKKEYFPNDKGNRPFFQRKEYEQLPDGSYIATFRIGRENLMKKVIIDNDPFCRKNSHNRKVGVYNRMGEKIAEFSNLNVCSLITGKNRSTLQARAKRESKFNIDGLIYKNENK